MEVEEVKRDETNLIVRTIFREIDNPSLCDKNFLNINLTKLFTIPLKYRGPFKYGHSEILKPTRSRFSIRKENPNDGPVEGVYLISQSRGLNDPKNLELLNQKYKLVFAFVIDDEQNRTLENFINTHRNEKYSAKVANWNIIVRKIFKKHSKKLMINDYENKKRKSFRWDCITLTLRCLVECQLIPEFRKDGSKTPLLGMTPHAAAMMLLDMYQKGELPHCKYLISKELLGEEEYIKRLKLFYEKGCKIIRS